MSADPTFTMICDNQTGDLAEEVRMASSLVKLFNAWKRAHQPTSTSTFAYWGPWNKNTAKSSLPYGEK
jgi:inhibitor of KinA sporulation pathway (predicted exonuclease)